MTTPFGGKISRQMPAQTGEIGHRMCDGGVGASMEYVTQSMIVEFKMEFASVKTHL